MCVCVLLYFPYTFILLVVILIMIIPLTAHRHRGRGRLCGQAGAAERAAAVHARVLCQPLEHAAGLR